MLVTLFFLVGLIFAAKAQDPEGVVFSTTASVSVTSWASWDKDGTSISGQTSFPSSPTWPAGLHTSSDTFPYLGIPTMPPVPPQPSDQGNVGSSSASSTGNKHQTLAIVLPTILSILGAVTLVVGLVLFNRRRSRLEASRRRRSWFNQNSNRWVPDRKEMTDLERRPVPENVQSLSTVPPVYQGRN